jgi:SOS response regulatory protein OraA/RecX
VSDTEVWVKTHSPYPNCTGYKAFTLRLQFNYEKKSPEMVVIVGEVHSVHNKSLNDSLFSEINADNFGWVVYGTEILKHKFMTDNARRHPDQLFPCIQHKLREQLKFPIPAPDKGNRYLKWMAELEQFKKDFLESPTLSEILTLALDWKVTTPKYFNTDPLKTLQFGEGSHIHPKFGMPQFGPKELIHDDVVFFFIGHESDKPLASTIDEYFRGNNASEFKGISAYLKMHYCTEPHLSIWFTNKENPLSEIEAALKAKQEQQMIVDTKRYVAIYLSPHSKTTPYLSMRKIYYELKEFLLNRNIVTQTIDVAKAWSDARKEITVEIEVENEGVKTKKTVTKALVKKGFFYSLANIAVAIYAKLGGTPWCFESQKEEELVVGISAYTSKELGKKFVGSAFSFTNEGRFRGFECFSQENVTELAGSIKLAVKNFQDANLGIKRLVIHFYKRLNYYELKPIQKALSELKLPIPVIVVSVNKSFSDDLIGFDLTVAHKMPVSGNYLPINNYQYLLYNNQLTQAANNKPDEREGFPFPLKISLQKFLPETKVSTSMTEDEIIPIFEQVCRFSLLYWKSVSRQWLPVTLRYPEMLAQIAPHFKYKDWGELGSDSLWFI